MHLNNEYKVEVHLIYREYIWNLYQDIHVQATEGMACEF